MTFVWIAIGVLLLIVVMITLTDLIRRGGSTWSLIGWCVLVIVLPFIGAIAYWAMRRPDKDEIEQQRLVDEDVRRAAARRPVGPQP